MKMFILGLFLGVVLSYTTWWTLTVKNNIETMIKAFQVEELKD